MPEIKVEIHSVCDTSNNAARLGHGPGQDDQISWTAKPLPITPFSVKFPGNVFAGYPNGGEVQVPTGTLTLVSAPTPQTIVNYVYQNGDNCHQVKTSGGPSIVIDS